MKKLNTESEKQILSEELAKYNLGYFSEENGLTVHFNLKIGDKVYAYCEEMNDELLEYKVVSIELIDSAYPQNTNNFSFSDIIFHCSAYDIYNRWINSIDVSPSDFGDTVFLTIKDAKTL